MKIVKCAFFTAASCAGKTTLQSEFRRDNLAVLDSDSEIMERCFDILVPGKGYHERIGPLSQWKHLREEFDFDRLFRLHHRDWFHRADQPQGFVAVGWIYAFSEFRNMVRRAFVQLPNVKLECRLFVLRLSHGDFFLRYMKAQQKRLESGHDLFRKTSAQQREHCDVHYDSFWEIDLDLCDDICTSESTTDEELRKSISQFLSMTDSGSV